MARRHLAGAGCYREEQVADLARHMAARSLILEQPPRLPALPPAQPALPIYQGHRQTPAGALRVALGQLPATPGSEQRVLPEEVRQAIHEAVASLARRGKL